MQPLCKGDLNFCYMHFPIFCYNLCYMSVFSNTLILRVYIGIRSVHKNKSATSIWLFTTPSCKEVWRNEPYLWSWWYWQMTLCHQNSSMKYLLIFYYSNCGCELWITCVAHHTRNMNEQGTGLIQALKLASDLPAWPR